ncbi:hypothetical protein HDU96_001935 [Phlyctochytrium bullatum]|nr:hypothetical protein HDU96_001935 [Phlyctochytrium bullatum]
MRRTPTLLSSYSLGVLGGLGVLTRTDGAFFLLAVGYAFVWACFRDLVAPPSVTTTRRRSSVVFGASRSSSVGPFLSRSTSPSSPTASLEEIVAERDEEEAPPRRNPLLRIAAGLAGVTTAIVVVVLADSFYYGTLEFLVGDGTGVWRVLGKRGGDAANGGGDERTVGFSTAVWHDLAGVIALLPSHMVAWLWNGSSSLKDLAEQLAYTGSGALSGGATSQLTASTPSSGSVASSSTAAPIANSPPSASPSHGPPVRHGSTSPTPDLVLLRNLLALRGHPASVLVNNVRYNMDIGNLAEHGLHSRWLHAVVNLPLLFGPLHFLAFWPFLWRAPGKKKPKEMRPEEDETSKVVGDVARAAELDGQKNDVDAIGMHPALVKENEEFEQWEDEREVGRLKATVLMSVNIAILFFGLVLLSGAPHQEPRFLLPLVLPLVFLASLGIHLLTRPNRKRFWGVWIIYNLATTIFFGCLHQSGLVPTLFLGLETRGEVATSFERCTTFGGALVECVNGADGGRHSRARDNRDAAGEVFTRILFRKTFGPPLHLFALGHGRNVTTNDIDSTTTRHRVEVIDLAGSPGDRVLAFTRGDAQAHPPRACLADEIASPPADDTRWKRVVDAVDADVEALRATDRGNDGEWGRWRRLAVALGRVGARWWWEVVVERKGEGRDGIAGWTPPPARFAKGDQVSTRVLVVTPAYALTDLSAPLLAQNLTLVPRYLSGGLRPSPSWFPLSSVMLFPPPPHVNTDDLGRVIGHVGERLPRGDDLARVWWEATGMGVWEVVRVPCVEV